MDEPSSKQNLATPNKNVELLCPWFGEKVAIAIKDCNDNGYPIKVTEGYRSPQRQDYLWEQGRTRPGPRVTNAKAWQSFHQYALAIDICFFEGKKPYYPKKDDTLWDRVDNIMEEHGFESIGFERPHHQIARGLSWQEAYKISREQGLLAVWNLVELRGKF